MEIHSIEHFRIFSAISNLVLGTWIAYYAHQRTHRLTYSYVHYLVRYIIFYNGCIAIMLLSKYVSLNLIDKFSADVIARMTQITIFSVLLVLFGMTHTLLKIEFGLKEKKVPRGYYVWFDTGLACITLLCLLRIILLNQVKAVVWFTIIFGCAIASLAMFEFSIYFRILRFAKRCRERARRKISRAFGLLFLSRYIFPIAVFLPIGIINHWVIPDTVAPFAAFVILLYINLVPLFWLQCYFLPYAENLLHIVESKSILDDIFKKYHISKREGEILKLIVDGKSNAEIEGTLFISYHTVKNHIYNLYQKLGVRTRYELVHLVTRYQEREVRTRKEQES